MSNNGVIFDEQRRLRRMVVKTEKKKKRGFVEMQYEKREKGKRRRVHKQYVWPGGERT